MLQAGCQRKIKETVYMGNFVEMPCDAGNMMPMAKNPLLFVSHASEDKKPFVEELVEKLRQEYEVWYDKYELKIGDSLRAKIDEGLRNCDFGIVVLSPHFFEKRWPQNELSALFSLEVHYGKVILPIWHNITKKEVANYSPLLADRFAAKSSDGVDHIVSEIRAAISASERTVEIKKLDSARSALQLLTTNLDAKEYSEKHLNTQEGVLDLDNGFQKIKDLLISEIETINRGSDTPRFLVKQQPHQFLVIHGPYLVTLELYLNKAYANTAQHAEVLARFVKRQHLHSEYTEPDRLEDLHFFPKALKGQELHWVEEEAERDILSTKQAVDRILTRFGSNIEDFEST